jgi:predicted transcriptional regulator
MLIKQIYHKKNPIAIHQNSSINDALNILADKAINGLVVKDDAEKVVGVISIQDIAAATVPHQFQENVQMAGAMLKEGFFLEMVKDIAKWPVSKIMRSDFIRVTPEDHVIEVMADFLHNDLYIIPIFDNGDILGIITRSEIKEALIKTIRQ